MLLYIFTESSDTLHLIIHWNILSRFGYVFCYNLPSCNRVSHLLPNPILSLNNLFQHVQWISGCGTDNPLGFGQRLEYEMVGKLGGARRGWDAGIHTGGATISEVTGVGAVVGEFWALPRCVSGWLMRQAVPMVHNRLDSTSWRCYRNVHWNIFHSMIGHRHCNNNMIVIWSFISILIFPLNICFST